MTNLYFQKVDNSEKKVVQKFEKDIHKQERTLDILLQEIDDFLQNKNGQVFEI